MSKSSSLYRFIALLVFVSLLVSPQSMIAQELNPGVVEGSPVAAPDGETNPEEGNPEEGNPEESNPEVGAGTEGASEDSTLDVPENNEVQRPAIDEPADLGPASRGGDFSILQDPVEDPNYYCRTHPKDVNFSGGTLDWLRYGAEQGFNVDCFNVFAPVIEACSVSVTMESLIPWGTYRMVWVEGNYEGNLPGALGQTWNTEFPIVATPGQTRTVTVFMEGPERDVTRAEFIGDADADWTFHWGAGKAYTIDCPATLTPAIPTYPTFTASVCEDGVVIMPTMTPPANTDAITYGETIIVADNEYGRIFRLHAYANDGFTFEGASLPGGWRMLSATEARFDTTRTIAECELAVPTYPAFTASVCEDGIVIMPTMTPPANTEAITYGETIHVADNEYGRIFSLRAYANDGFTFEGVSLPGGWRIVSATEARYDTTRSIAECEPAVLAAPGVVLSVCEDGVVERPNLIAPEDSESVTYGEVRFIADSLPYGAVFHITATANPGFTFEGVELGPGWHYVSPTEAEFRTTRPIAECLPAELAAPGVVASVCVDGVVERPNLIAPENSESVTYGEVRFIADSLPYGAVFHITATVNDGFTFENADLGPGWHYISPSEAEFRTTRPIAECLPAVLDAPGVVPSVCVDGVVERPDLIAPEDSESVTYGEVRFIADSLPYGAVFHITATVNDGYTFENVDLGPGWHYISPSEAEFRTTRPIADCDPAMPMMPEITSSVCVNGEVDHPTVTAPTDTDTITYGEVEAIVGADFIDFSLTATLGDGYTFEGVDLPEGWTMVTPTEALFEITLDIAECEVVTPELPVLVAAVCNNDEPVNPSLEVPEDTDGITYGEVTVGPANSVLLSLTATANAGYTFVGAEMPEGWTMVSPTEAVYELVADTIECPVEKDEKPKKDKEVPEVKELPSTGAGSNPAPMVGIAASAAAAIAGAGLFFTNRKR